MTALDQHQAWLAMTRIEAEEMLLGIERVSYPHMTKEGQRKTHRRLHELAFPDRFSEARAMTIDDLARMLNHG